MDDDFPDFNVECIVLRRYVIEVRDFILYNLKNKYKNLKYFDCTKCDLTELPDLHNYINRYLKLDIS